MRESEHTSSASSAGVLPSAANSAQLVPAMFLVLLGLARQGVVDILLPQLRLQARGSVLRP